MTMELTNIHGHWDWEQVGLTKAIAPTGKLKNWVWGRLGCNNLRYTLKANTGRQTVLGKGLAPTGMHLGLRVGLVGVLRELPW